MKASNRDLKVTSSQSFPKAWPALGTINAVPGFVRHVLRATRRQLQLTPMKRVLNELIKRGVPLGELDALEVFGCSGDGHVKDYASLVSTLEIWEIDPQFETTLHKHFPNATIKITDSYEELKRTNHKYDLIVVDNGTSTRPGGYCEHFDLFPDLFRIAEDSCIIILNVIPQIDEKDAKDYPYLFNDEQQARRRIFYRTDNPERVTFPEMLGVYTDMCRTAGFGVNWHFLERRNFLYYLVLQISKAVSDNVRS